MTTEIVQVIVSGVMAIFFLPVPFLLLMFIFRAWIIND